MREQQPYGKISTSETTILVVDDIATNIQLVGGILQRIGYDVIAATSAKRALEMACSEHPDLILLDLMMPEKDGIQICRELKENPGTENIPVIFLTAADADHELSRAFSAGAVDFLAKPFNQAELTARVRAHVELKLMRDRLEQVNREKSYLMHMAAHDLRNPLGIIQLNLDVLRGSLGIGAGNAAAYLNTIGHMVERMQTLLRNVFSMQGIEEGRQLLNPEIVDAGQLIRELCVVQRALAARKQISVEESLPDRRVEVLVDRNAFLQIFENLLSNAIKFTPPGKRVGIDLTQAGNFWRFSIWDEGPGIHPEDQPLLFKWFKKLRTQPTAGEGSSGLGLAIVKQLIDRVGADVNYKENPGGGSRFVVDFPLF